MPKTIQELEALADVLAAGLPDVTSKKMFGCYALWANDNVFALVWKTGRLGVKLPESKAYDDLMKLKGSEPWKAGPMKMAHWVLVPEALHSKSAELKKWFKKAHAQCSVLEKKKVAKKTKAK